MNELKADVKPGYKTTEFWLSAAASIVGLLLASDVIPTDGAAAKLLGVITMALSTMGYSVSRGMAKKALPMLLCMGLALPVLSGCSTPARTAYVTGGVVRTTADTLIDAWCDYVVAGKATKSQDAKARDLYGKYQAAMALAGAAVDSYLDSKSKDRSSIDTTMRLVADTSAEFVAFVRSIMDEQKSALPPPMGGFQGTMPNPVPAWPGLNLYGVITNVPL